jgi:hypothetical protein
MPSGVEDCDFEEADSLVRSPTSLVANEKDDKASKLTAAADSEAPASSQAFWLLVWMSK